jgi:hypothetical protein
MKNVESIKHLFDWHLFSTNWMPGHMLETRDKKMTKSIVFISLNCIALVLKFSVA